MTDQIQNVWPTLVPQSPHISKIQSLSQSRHHSVWLVTTADHSRFVVKHHIFATLTQGKPYDLLDVEQKVTTLLQHDHVAIPQIVATDHTLGLSVYEWCGNQTLDDFCQHTHTTDIAPRVIQTLLNLEQSFHKNTTILHPHIAPGSTSQDTLTSFEEATTTLTQLLHALLPYPQESAIPQHWQTILQTLKQAPLTLGPTDYNARNIVLSDTHQPHILELTKIGYDWPERRLIQYATSLGAHLPNGQIIGLLTPQNAADYAQTTAKYRSVSAQQILTCLDMHHLIFFLFCTMQCLHASKQSDHPWQNINTRLQNIKTALATPYSQNVDTNFFRQQFQK